MKLRLVKRIYLFLAYFVSRA